MSMRLAIIVSHPIQYYSPWFRHVAVAMDCVTSDESRVTGSEVGGRRSEVGDQRSETRDQGTASGSESPPARREGGGWNPLHATSDSQRNALRVFYLWDFGVTEKTDKGFGASVKWDVDLLEGYDYEFVPNVSKRPGTDWFWGVDNPELLTRVKDFAPDAVLQFGYNYKALVGFDLRWPWRRVPLWFRGDSHLLAESGEQRIRHEAYGKRLKQRVRQLALRLLFKRFACFLAVGKANADYFRAHGVPEDKIVFCPHVVDNAFFSKEKNASGEGRVTGARGLRAELGIKEDELVFLFAGKLEEKKQPDRLLEAFIEADVNDATLLFVGNGVLESELRSRVAGDRWRVKGNDIFEKGRKRVAFLPFQNQTRMPDVYRAGDVLVLPSKGRFETWGLAVNEAACCGLPAIVGSHVGCAPDLIEQGVTGWSFPSGDGRALEETLEAAARERGRLAAMGDALRKRVLEEYSYERATRALLGALDRLAAGQHLCGG